MVRGRLRLPVMLVAHPPTLIDRLAVAVAPAESAACTVKSNVPASNGEPEITPTGLNDSPGGSHLAETDQSYGGTPPLTASIGTEYRVPSIASGKLVVVTDTGQATTAAPPGCCPCPGHMRFWSRPSRFRTERPGR